MKKAIAIILSIMLILAITIPATAVSSIAVKSIKLNYSKITLTAGQTSNLKVTFTPANTTQNKLTYSTSNKKIATVDTAGKITGVSAGTTTITVYTLNKNIFAKCNVTISQPEKLGGKISYMTWATNPEKNFPQSQMDLFNKKYPDVKVDVVTFNGVDEYLKAQKIRLMSNDGVDVLALRSETLADYVKSGYLEELTGKPFLKNFNDDYYSQFTVDGKVYSIPGTLDLIGVWYNKDLFKKLNLNIPKTWTEFLSVCGKIKASGVNPLMNGGKDSWPMEFDAYPFIQSIYVKDPNIFSKLDKGEAKYTDPQWIDAFQKIIDFYKKGYIAKECLAMGYDQAAQLFDQGKTAMYIQGEWAGQALVNENKKPTFDYGVFALPYNDQETLVPVTIGSTIGVNANSKNKKAAMALLEFLASDIESSKLMNAVMGNFCPVKGVPIGDKPAAVDWQELIKMKSNNFWYSVQYPGANAELCKQLQTAFAGKTTAQDMAKAMQSVQDKKTK